MRPTTIHLFALLCLCASVRCGVFDDEPTVTKARCYANCFTMVSKLGLNDSSCESRQCVQCRKPCEQTFISLDNCSQSCNSSICNQSCIFIKVMKSWTSVYDGNKTVITPPGVATATAQNATSLTLSWPPPVNASGTVVYLLKVDYNGDATSRFPFDKIKLRGRVFVNSKAILTPNDVCRYVFFLRGRSQWNGMNFFFTVVALTESSTLVEGTKSSDIRFNKTEPVKSVYDPRVMYDASGIRDDKVRFQVSITPPPGLSNVISRYAIRIRCAIYDKVVEVKASRNISILIYQKLSPCSMTVTVYSLIKCLPSKPKKFLYEYKGCHSVENFDRLFCCSLQPEKTPDSARTVRNLTYTPLQITDDFRFNTRVTWQPPTHSCPGLKDYSLEYGDANEYEEFLGRMYWKSTKKKITNSYINLTDIKPGIQMKFVITPRFGNFPNVGVKSELLFNTTVGVPLDKTSIKTLQHRILPFSPSDMFAINMSWVKPDFEYSVITSYNVTYEAQGGVWKSNLTVNLYHVVTGLDYGQLLIFQVKPVFAHPWIKTAITTKSVRLPVPHRDDLKIQDIKELEPSENKEQNVYSISFTWSSPPFNRTVSFYEVSYALTGYLSNELDCPSKNSSKRGCMGSTTKTPTIQLRGILPSERVGLTIKPVFVNTTFFQGEPSTREVQAPAPRKSLVMIRDLQYQSNDSQNKTFNITWRKPLFIHSVVRHYFIEYEFSKSGVTTRRKRRAAEYSIVYNHTTIKREFTVLREMRKGDQLDLKVTPVFEVQLISGQAVQLTITRASPPDAFYGRSWKTSEIALLVTGLVLLLLLLLLFTVMYIRWKKEQPLKPGVDVAIIDKWEVSPDNLRFDEMLGEGAFGKVFKGMLTELPQMTSIVSKRKISTISASTPFGNEEGYVVAVKVLQDFVNEDERREFLREIQLMKDVGSHRNIVNMLGCGTLSDPMFLIVEYLPNGDLLHYLRKRRGKAKQHSENDPRGPNHSSYYWLHCNHNNNSFDNDNDYLQPIDSTDVSRSKCNYNEGFYADGNQTGMELVSVKDTRRGQNNRLQHNFRPEDFDFDEDVITSGDLMAFAWQVSKGMEYLAKRGYVHRDLAARNVLVGENKEAKIADFGLTRHMYNELYQAKTNRRLPIKWMSIEAIFDQSFTAQSDVWSYGVFLWELVTLGGSPYPTKSNRELLRCLKEGYRMEKPDTCDDEVYDIMLKCWQQKPDDRPTFTSIELQLEEMMMRDNPYFDPSSVDESRDYYNVPSFKSIEDSDSDDMDDGVLDDIFGGKNENCPVQDIESLVTEAASEHGTQIQISENELNIGLQFGGKKEHEQEKDVSTLENTTAAGQCVNDKEKQISKYEMDVSETKDEDTIALAKLENANQVIDKSGYECIHFV